MKAEKSKTDSHFAKLSEELAREINKATKELSQHEEIVREVAAARRDLKKNR